MKGTRYGAFTANELKNQIIKFENNIDYNKKYGPVYKTISTIPLYEEVETNKEVSAEKLLPYIIDRLNSIENSIGAKNEKVERRARTYTIKIKVLNNSVEMRDTITNMLVEKHGHLISYIEYLEDGYKIKIETGKVKFNMIEFIQDVRKDIEQLGIMNAEFSYELK